MTQFNFDNRKGFIVTHGDCPDGSACVVFASALFPQIKPIFGIHKFINDQVKKAFLEVPNGGVFFIADICCDEDVLDDLISLSIKKDIYLGIFEHHATRGWLKKKSLPKEFSGDILFDNDRCGSKIMYDFFIDHKPISLNDYKEFSLVINDRDLWLNKDNRGKKLAKLHQIYGDLKFISRFKENVKVDFSDSEKILLDYVEAKELERIEKALSNMELLRDSEGYAFGVVYEAGDSSDLLNAAIEKYDLEYAIMMDLHRSKGSIRGKGNMDCSKFAEKRGGGGHPCASGFPLQFEKPKIN